MTKQEKIKEESTEVADAFKAIENRRAFIKKAMKPAEDAAKDLVNSTATEKVRLQGTKETTMPKLKPFTERFIEVRDRKELGKLIESAKKEKRPWKVVRSVTEGFRYTFCTKYLTEDKDEVEVTPEAKATVDLIATDDKVSVDKDKEEKSPEEKAFDVLMNQLTLSICKDDEHCVVLCGIEDCTKIEVSEKEMEILKPFLSKADEETNDKGGDSTKEDETTAIDINDFEISGVSEEEIEEVEESLKEASSAEKRAFKHGGEDYVDLLVGKSIARIKDKSSRDAAIAAIKAGRKDVVNAFTGNRKDRQADVAIQDKMRKMKKAGTADESLEESIEIEISEPSKVTIEDNGSVSITHTAEPIISSPEIPCDDCDDVSDLTLDLDVDNDILKEAEEEVAIQNTTSEPSVSDNVEIRLDDLEFFKPVGGARDTWDIIVKNGKVKDFANILVKFAKDGKMTTTDLNDMLWFESDWIFRELGINPLIKSGDDVIETEVNVIEPEEGNE